MVTSVSILRRLALLPSSCRHHDDISCSTCRIKERETSQLMSADWKERRGIGGLFKRGWQVEKEREGRSLSTTLQRFKYMTNGYLPAAAWCCSPSSWLTYMIVISILICFYIYTTISHTPAAAWCCSPS
jgi:hypothetical protein